MLVSLVRLVVLLETSECFMDTLSSTLEMPAVRELFLSAGKLQNIGPMCA